MATTISTLPAPRPAVRVPATKGQTVIFPQVEYVNCLVKVKRVNDHYLMVTAHQGLSGTAETKVALYFNRNRNAWVGDYYNEDSDLVEIGEAADLKLMVAAAMLDTAWRGRENRAW